MEADTHASVSMATRELNAGLSKCIKIIECKLHSGKERIKGGILVCKLVLHCVNGVITSYTESHCVELELSY